MGCFGFLGSGRAVGGDLGLQQIAPRAEEGLVLLRGFGQSRHVPCLPGHRLLHRPHLRRNLREGITRRDKSTYFWFMKKEGKWAGQCAPPPIGA